MTRASSPSAVDRQVGIGWITRHAQSLTTLDPDAPLTDLEPLRDMVSDAVIVGLGAPTHQAHELSAIRCRVLKFLVEEMGFRALAMEVDWTTGIQVDEFVRTGSGDPTALLTAAGPVWQTEEMLDVVRWMRSFNEQQPTDPVRFVGLEVDAVQAIAYDAVDEFVRRTAPERLDERRSLYGVLRPTGRIADHVEWYRNQQDKQPFIERARHAHGLVEHLPVAEGHALALQHARVIVGFYEGQATDSSVDYVERRLAETTIWWHEHTMATVEYWSSNSHMANGNPRVISYSAFPRKPHRNAGSYLRDHFATGYTSIGVTFDHGSVPFPVRSPSPAFADTLLGEVGLDALVIDLHGGQQPETVQAWLTAPAMTRLIFPNYDPEHDADFYMSGGSLAEWFDAIIHIQEVTAVHPLDERE